MKRICLTIVVTACVALFAVKGFGDEQNLTTAQAKDHVGQTNTVCGTVASARQADLERGVPTFLNLDKPHPDKVFTVVIWARNLTKFEKPPHEAYTGKRICVTGLIELHKGVPQIEVKDPSQITVPADQPTPVEPAAEPKTDEPKPDEPTQ